MAFFDKISSPYDPTSSVSRVAGDQQLTADILGLTMMDAFADGDFEPSSKGR